MTDLNPKIITLFQILEKNKFRVIEKEDVSVVFDNVYYIYSNGSLEIMVSRERSFEAIDIRPSNDKKIWFDMRMVKTMLLNEDLLGGISSIDEVIDFIANNFNVIMDIFSPAKCLTTKKRLMEMYKERARLEHPNTVLTLESLRSNRTWVEKQADIAWKEKNFRAVVDFYGLILSDLTQLQKKKYEYSLKKVNGRLSNVNNEED